MEIDIGTDHSEYQVEDFVFWNSNGVLDITPKFQRRSVWRLSAQSFFIDTILRGMTVPPIYLRLVQNQEKTGTLRQVIDGQQRVRSILAFIENGFQLAKSPASSWAGKRFSDLSAAERRKIIEYKIPTEVFKGISDQQVLEVFCRLNMNGVPLNKQELRNGRYFGFFKQTAYDLAFEYLEFWRRHKLFTEQGIARMLEAELTSELLIVGISGMQDKKKSINNFYADFEKSYPSQKRDEKRFRETLSTISETFEDDLADTAFHRPPLFYALYCVVYHHVFGLDNTPRKSPLRRLNSSDRNSLREATILLSDMIARSKDPAADVPAKYAAFVTASQRQTDNIGPRKAIFNSLFGEAF